MKDDKSLTSKIWPAFKTKDKILKLFIDLNYEYKFPLYFTVNNWELTWELKGFQNKGF